MRDINDESPPKRARVQASSANENGLSSNAVPLIPPSLGSGVLETLTARVAHLESLLGVTDSSAIGTGRAPDTVHRESLPSLNHGPPSRQNILTGVFPHAHSFVKSFLTSKGDSRIGKVAQELRNLHDALKIMHQSRRSLVAPTSMTEIRDLIPPLDVCQRLTEIYFDNLEHCFRILHRPTFDAQLIEFFVGTSTSPEFLSQLVAVLSISAILGITQECLDVAHAYDSRLIRISVKYIEDHLASLSNKKRNTLPPFQTRSMLVLLRCMRLDKQSELWELTGGLLRQALVMAMDRDPTERSEECTAFEAEMRRRLWMSTVELDMMMAILCNMPCLIPEFTCRAPKNINDRELLSENLDSIPSRPLDEWTDCLCQCFLAESIEQRLHGCKDLQSAPDLKYNHVLSHTRILEQVLRNLPPSLRFNNPEDNVGKGPARLMARMEVDITIRRPLMHLYTAFAYANDEKDAFAEARGGFLQSCLMVTTYQDLFDPKFSELQVERPTGYWDFFFNVYRHEINQSILGLCLEIKRLANATDAVLVTNQHQAGWKGPSYTKSSMMHAVKDVLEPMTRRIAHSGADVKDLAYLTLVFSSVRLGKPDEHGILEGIDELVTTCRSQLEKENFPVATPSNAQFESSTSNPTPGFDFDPTWMNMPALSDGFYFPNGIPFDFDPS